MAEVIAPISNKTARVARGAVKKPQTNRSLIFIGLGLLTLGAGAGIWALVKKAGDKSFDGESDIDVDDFRRSGQY